MDKRLQPLEAWRDDPVICTSLDFIREGADTIDTLVDCVVALAERARYAEDYMLIHTLVCAKEIPPCA